jgi:hypothetical protein
MGSRANQAQRPLRRLPARRFARCARGRGYLERYHLKTARLNVILGVVTMQSKRQILRAIASGVVGVATLVFVVCAMLTFAAPKGEATPALAKGKPCTTCHAGSPPSKSNLRR